MGGVAENPPVALRRLILYIAAVFRPRRGLMTEATRRGVLVVEDEEGLRTLLAAILEMENYVVYTAADGQDGLAALDRHGDDIQLMITDLTLPRMGGLELISAVRTRRPSIKLIGISGLSGDDVLATVLRAGADAFMPKPFLPKDAIAKVREVLGQP